MCDDRIGKRMYEARVKRLKTRRPRETRNDEILSILWRRVVTWMDARRQEKMVKICAHMKA